MSFLPLLYTNDVTNNSFYSNPDYDAIVDQIKVEKDPAKFAELVLQADELVLLPHFRNGFCNLLYIIIRIEGKLGSCINTQLRNRIL